MPIVLDVDDRSAVFAAFKTAHDEFGRIDVVINTWSDVSTAAQGNLVAAGKA